MKITNIDKLTEWFGGTSTVKYNKSRCEYTILLYTDDLMDEFTFWFTDMDILKYGEKEVVLHLFTKYINQMEIEQQIMRKGLRDCEQSRENIRLCS